jgi:glycosyltransferase involved in cell wall biosynthesis
MKPLTIAHIGPSALPVLHRYGGAIERRMLELARLQVDRGNTVTVYSAGNDDSSAQFAGFDVKTVPCRYRGSLRRFEFLKGALKDLRDRHPDVVHFHSMPEGAAFAKSLKAKKILSFDYYIFRRGKSTPLYWWYRQALRRFNRLLPVSDYCLQNSKAYWKLPEDRTRFFYNGVNLAQFRPDPDSAKGLRSSLGLGDAPVIMYIGRVCRQKGTDVLLDAYSRLKKDIPEARLVVAGPTQQFGTSSIDDLTKRITNEGGIYLGAVEEEKLAAVYNLCDVFVMPTRMDEMFGMAAIEAQASGKPVVCSEHGGLIEVISKQSGLFFPVGDAQALARQITTLLLNPELRQRMSLAARENAKRFDWARLVEELDGIYRQN